MKHIDVHGRRLAYEVAGAGANVLLLHGNFASRRWWREQLDRPPTGLRLIAPDLPNFGDSDALGAPITLDAYARAVLGLADALELDTPTLVGHSLGGAVVHRLAARAPERWRALLLVSPPSPASFPTPEAHYPVLESFHGRPDLLGPALAAMMPARVPPNFEDLVSDALRMHRDAFTGNARALEDGLPDGAVARFDGPVLVLRGALDALITEDVARAAADAYPNGRLETWPDVGHSPQLEAPERFTELLAEFLGEPP